MKKILALTAVMVLVLAGCGSSDSAGNGKSIGFVTDTGGINDKSFNQGTWEGIQKYSEENGIDASYIETKESSQYEQNLNASAADNDIVIAAGFTFASPIYNAANANPDTDFVLIDAEPTDTNGDVQELDNVHSYLFSEQEAGYLVGYIAGKETKTDQVGFIGGMQSPPVQKFGYGFVQGVQAANKKATVEFNYVGSFDDVAKGKTTAATMYSKGVDIIFGAAGGVNTGIIEAAKEEVSKGNEDWFIGVDRDMYDDGKYDGDKSLVMTSAVKNVGKAAQEGIKAHYDGDFKKGTTTLTFEDDGVGLPDENPNLDGSVVEDAKSSLEKAGDLATTKKDLDKDLKIEVNGKY